MAVLRNVGAHCTTALVMSSAEIARCDMLMRLNRGEIQITDAMELLGLGRRQVYRLLERLRERGAAGLASRKRRRPSNRGLSDACRGEALALGITIKRDGCTGVVPGVTSTAHVD